MKRASRSSTYSSAHSISNSEASAIFDPASSLPSGASAANTEDTECNSSSRMFRYQRRLVIRHPGDIPGRRGILLHLAAAAAHSTTWLTSSLQEPHPLPAWVAVITPGRRCSPPRTQATRSPLDTPLQLQTWASSDSSVTPTRHVRGAESNIKRSARRAGAARCRTHCVRNDDLPDVADAEWRRPAFRPE